MHIYDDTIMALHIMGLNIDEHIRQASPEIVHRIARITISEKSWYYYSFATKYCSWHSPEDYPIYDSYVDKMLWHYKTQDNFFEFARKDLRDYLKYKQILNGFREFYGLMEFSYKQIDKFLWIHGRELFS